MKVISTIIQWSVIVLGSWGLFMLTRGTIHFTGTLTGGEVILFALSIAFALVEVAKLFKCMKCVTGWTALILALVFHTPLAWMYLFVGLFAGALFGSLKTRYL